MKLLRVIRSLNPAEGRPMEGVRQITPHLAALGVPTAMTSIDPHELAWLQDQPFSPSALAQWPDPTATAAEWPRPTAP